MISYSRVAEIATRFVDKDYALCDKEHGYDCLSMILEFYQEVGFVFPETFKGFTEVNYGKKWIAGEGRTEYREFLENISSRVDVNYKLAGDLLVFRFGDDEMLNAGIYLGNGNALMCFVQGLRVVPFRFFKKNLIEVRRCQNQ